jgi:hypothetical protein
MAPATDERVNTVSTAPLVAYNPLFDCSHFRYAASPRRNVAPLKMSHSEKSICETTLTS